MWPMHTIITHIRAPTFQRRHFRCAATHGSPERGTRLSYLQSLAGYTAPNTAPVPTLSTHITAHSHHVSSDCRMLHFFCAQWVYWRNCGIHRSGLSGATQSSHWELNAAFGKGEAAEVTYASSTGCCDPSEAMSSTMAVVSRTSEQMEGHQVRVPHWEAPIHPSPEL